MKDAVPLVTSGSKCRTPSSSPTCTRRVYAGDIRTTGRLGFDPVVVEDNILRILTSGCLDPECPGGADSNSILNALEVVPSGFDVCDEPVCACVQLVLVCAVDGDGNVEGSWTGPLCVDVLGYQVFKDGALLMELGPEAASSATCWDSRASVYEVVPVFPKDEAGCDAMICTVTRFDLPFATPLRLNMGGPSTLDSIGRVWLGDGLGADPLRDSAPTDAGGSNLLNPWCPATVASVPDSFHSLGLGSAGSGRSVDLQLDSLGSPRRWSDLRARDPGSKTARIGSIRTTRSVCCPNRHYQIELQGEVVVADANTNEYSTSGQVGRTGRFSFDDVVVEDGLVRLTLLGCPDCPQEGPVDPNAILSAVEVLSSDSAPNTRCPNDLICSVEKDGSVRGVWTAPENVAVDSYELFRDDEPIAVLKGTATEFIDNAVLAKFQQYSVVPVTADGVCHPDLAMHCDVICLDCAFEDPVRINHGGTDRRRFPGSPLDR